MISNLFEKAIMVEERHLDQLLHVNNVTWLQWVQDMAQAHWENRTNVEIDSKYYWVVLDHFIEYKRPAVLGDEIIAKTHIEANSGPKSERHVAFYKGDQLCVRAKTNWCLIDRLSNRPVRIPQEIVSLFSNE